jgi:hypothetical protein
MGTRAIEFDNQAGTGAAADAAGAGGNSGDAAGGAGNGGSADSAANAGGTRAIDRSKLPALIRDMPEEQIGEVFNTMLEAVMNKGGSNGGRDMSGVPEHARPVAPAAPKQPTKEEFKKMLDPNDEGFNPEAAFKMFVDANYGGLINDIGRNASAGLKVSLRNRFKDFGTYEADVDKVLSRIPAAQVNEDLIINTYFQVKGYRATETEMREAARPPKTVEPSPARVDSSAATQFNDEETAVAKVMFPGAADPVAELRKAQALMDKGHVRVPGDAKPAPKGGK